MQRQHRRRRSLRSLLRSELSPTAATVKEKKREPNLRERQLAKASLRWTLFEKFQDDASLLEVLQNSHLASRLVMETRQICLALEIQPKIHRILTTVMRSREREHLLIYLCAPLLRQLTSLKLVKKRVLPKRKPHKEEPNRKKKTRRTKKRILTLRCDEKRN
jgi:hypothetical protein